ncbi:ABC transporter permease [Benzoatithermus flavus]|uniref:FtsX-like permease family protein n=1 Tax=Benzoatithermus flavus TaxID=3108223 RepID=A0ABU8XWR0_9PROT
MSRLSAWSLALRLAARDLRGTGSSFIVLLAALTLGVAIIAAVGILNRGVGTALSRDARVLLGGDVELEQANAPIAEADLARIVPPGAELGRVVETSTLATSASERSLAVSLKAVDGLYPLVGAVRLDPPLPLAEALRDRGAVVEPALLARLGMAVGDRVRVGEVMVRIAATLVREPDRVGGLFSLGPRMIVADATLEAARILQPGALARYEYRLALPEGIDAPGFVAELAQRFPDAGWRARSPRDVQPQVTRFTDRLATFLTLAGLTALLTGGLGIALTIETHLARRTATIATLKCLGASGAQVFRIYLGQVLLLAAAGTALGLVLGLLLPLLTRLLPEGTLPVAPDPGLYPMPLLLAAAAGLVTTFVFALWPLAIAREISPAGLFRALVAPPRRWPRRSCLALLAVAVLILAGIAIISVPQPGIGAWFVLTVAAAALLLWGLTRLILLGARRFGHKGGFALRLALANLHRPGSSSPRVIVGLGAGVTLLVAVAALAANLRREIADSLPTRAPALYLIDIQAPQRDTLAAILAEVPGARLEQLLPSLRARVVRIKGRPVEQVPIGSEVAWTVRRDRGLTYAATMPEGSELVAGAWWPADYAGPPLVSIDEEIARGYGVGIGDSLGFNVLGRLIEARIANIRREVDWSGGRLDFLFILDPATLQGAPHSFVASAGLPATEEPGLLDLLARRLPNVTPISLREIVARATELLARIELAVMAVAGVTLSGGVLALAGGILAARQRQRYETVVLKVLGARRAVLLRAFLVEYLVIGAAAAAVGGLLGSLAAWVVVDRVMHLPFSPAPFPLAGVLLLTVAAVLAVGAVSLWRLIGLPAAPVLREA